MTPASYRKGGAGMKIGFTVAASSLGKVLVAGTERGISAVYLGEDDRTLVSELQKEYPRAEIARSPAGNENWVKENLTPGESHAPSKELSLDVQATAFHRPGGQELPKNP